MPERIISAADEVPRQSFVPLDTVDELIWYAVLVRTALIFTDALGLYMCIPNLCACAALDEACATMIISALIVFAAPASIAGSLKAFLGSRASNVCA